MTEVMERQKEEKKGTGINGAQVVGGALAAVSSAVLLSTLGVAGTIIGAAVGSIIASVGGSLYTRTLDASRQQVAAQAAALKRVAQARHQVDAMRRGSGGSDTELRRASRDLSEAEAALEEAQGSGDDPEHPADSPVAPEALGSRLRRLPWKRVAIVAAVVFVGAMLVITGFELLTGRAVSSYTGGSDSATGSTVPGVGDTKPDRKPTDQPSDAPSQKATDPTAGPTEDTGTSGSTPTPSATPEPTVTPEPTEPTQLPSGSATATPGVG